MLKIAALSVAESTLCSCILKVLRKFQSGSVLVAPLILQRQRQRPRRTTDTAERVAASSSHHWYCRDSGSILVAPMILQRERERDRERERERQHPCRTTDTAETEAASSSHHWYCRDSGSVLVAPLILQREWQHPRRTTDLHCADDLTMQANVTRDPGLPFLVALLGLGLGLGGWPYCAGWA